MRASKKKAKVQRGNPPNNHPRPCSRCKDVFYFSKSARIHFRQEHGFKCMEKT